jgi:hypothetical protein
MLQKGTAKKVTIFINEGTRRHFGSLCDAIMEFLLHKEVSAGYRHARGSVFRLASGNAHAEASRCSPNTCRFVLNS